MEELSQSWMKLSLSEREGPECQLEEEFSSKEHIIASKFLMKRALNIEAVALKKWFQDQKLGRSCGIVHF